MGLMPPDEDPEVKCPDLIKLNGEPGYSCGNDYCTQYRNPDVSCPVRSHMKRYR
jgi:hypothetical protein